MEFLGKKQKSEGSDAQTDTTNLTFLGLTLAPGIVTFFSASYCPFCAKVKEFLSTHKITKVQIIEQDLAEKEGKITQADKDKLFAFSGFKTWPQIFVGLNKIGGCSDLFATAKDRSLWAMLDQAGISHDAGEFAPKKFDFDYFVIGGGSGGLASAKTAAEILGEGKVGMADYVRPSPQGTEWGIGGTCVNVGCIPKKLMHACGLLGESREVMEEVGFPKQDWVTKHSWEKMQHNVGAHIKRLNWDYQKTLLSKGVQVFEEQASFIDAHTIQLKDKDGKTQTVTADKILIAVGGRPRQLFCPGKEHAITSDDVFWLKKDPGKCLVVGASYVALECAGFLNATGHNTTVLVRSILLRGFDQDMAERIQKYMDELGTEFIRPGTVKEIKKLENGKLSVTFKDSKTGEDLFNGNARVFDTVLAAIGRDIECEVLNCENAGVKLNKWGKVITNESDQSNVPHIFSIGDCAQDRPELTPVAIQAGRFLSRRLFNGSKKLMNYDNVVTAVFTPLEYGAVGLNEVDAQKKFGEDDVDIYHTTFKPLEWNLVEMPSEMQTCKNDICYVKVVVQISTRKVLGIHFLGPNAGEVIMGYSVALNCGVTYEQLADTVGLHPSVSEEIVDLKVTKRENADAKKEGC